MAAVFQDEPLFASLRFAGVVLEQGALADSGRGPVAADVKPPQLSAQCTEDLQGLGAFRDERETLRKIAAAIARDEERSRAVSRVAAAAAARSAPSEGGSAFTQVQGSRGSASGVSPATAMWTCLECTLVNRAEDSKWCASQDLGVALLSFVYALPRRDAQRFSVTRAPPRAQLVHPPPARVAGLRSSPLLARAPGAATVPRLQNGRARCVPCAVSLLARPSRLPRRPLLAHRGARR